MKNIIIILLITLSYRVQAQELSIKATVEYINKYLPGIVDESVFARIKNPRISCDEFGNIVYQGASESKSNPELRNESYGEFYEAFSIKDATFIWIYEGKYENGEFAGYQIRFEKTKLSVPLLMISINNKVYGEKLVKAFIHLKKITKADPFK